MDILRSQQRWSNVFVVGAWRGEEKKTLYQTQLEKAFIKGRQCAFMSYTLSCYRFDTVASFQRKNQTSSNLVQFGNLSHLHSLGRNSATSIFKSYRQWVKSSSLNIGIHNCQHLPVHENHELFFFFLSQWDIQSKVLDEHRDRADP